MPDSLVKIIALILVAAGSIIFYHKRSLRYLQFFQQEEYTARRFIDWYLRKKAFDQKGCVALAAPSVVSFFFASWNYWWSVLISLITCIILFLVAHSEEDPRGSGKIKLKITSRASRIYWLAYIFYVVTLCLVGLICFSLAKNYCICLFFLCQYIFIQTQPFWLLLSNAFLMPYESNLQENFANEARAIIKKYNPTIIGITGSYGKTSTKIILKDILGSVYPTFSTPGSINSYMGVTREIRERLKPEHKFAVIEMGAYYRGSIKKMCSLTPPKAGIITTVGIMHLERFGGQEAVFQAKSELAQAIPSDGILVCNGDNEYTRKIAANNPKKVTLLYGMEPDKGPLDATMFEIKSQENGSSFKIRWQEKTYEGFVGLLGRPMLSNVLASFTMSCALGLSPEVVLASMRSVKTESNRLEPVCASIRSLTVNNTARSGQILRLNDAYNSNPIGFAAALDVLAHMPGKRKILVTPGMIELGDRQETENLQAAKLAATVCDLVLVIGETNKKALIEGLLTGGISSERYKEFLNMRLALNYLGDKYCQDGDIVLIENDLPDLYETVVSF